MKKYYCVIGWLCMLAGVRAQGVAVNKTGSPVSDPKAMLEVRRASYSKLKVQSTNYSDTAVLELSNRNFSNQGTDFLFTSYQESGLVLSSRSDVMNVARDSLLTISPFGKIASRSLRGNRTRYVAVTADGELTTTLPRDSAYMNVPAAGFQSRYGGSTASFYAMDATSTAGFLTGSTGSMVAPLNLPDGAEILTIKAYYIDNSATNLTFSLFRSPSLTNSIHTVLSMTTAGASGSGAAISSMENGNVFAPIVDNKNYSYSLAVDLAGGCCWDASNLRVKSVVVTYLK